ncbi:MAG: ABC transporter substrate-binding protein [Thermodesulfobacteriota bacterium]
MPRFLIGILMMLMATAVVFGPAWCADNVDRTREVEVLLKAKIDAVLAILGDGALSQPQKQDRIMKTIEPVMDFPLMAKLTLGRQHWGKLSPAQQTEFVDLFVKRLKQSYLDKTALYSDQKVVYEKAAQEGSKVSASMNIIAQDKTVVVLYKFYLAGAAWKIYDVEVEGVSFVKSYMAQFDAILKNGTVDNLFAELRKPVAEQK